MIFYINKAVVAKMMMLAATVSVDKVAVSAATAHRRVKSGKDGPPVPPPQEGSYYFKKSPKKKSKKNPHTEAPTSDDGDAGSLCAPGDTVCIARSVCKAAYDAGQTDLETVCQGFWPRKTPNTCDPHQKYASMQDAKDEILSDQTRNWTHGRAPDLFLEEVIWFGEDGMHHLDCDGLYPEINKFDWSDNTDPTKIVIRNWQKPPFCSTSIYVLPTDGSSMEIPILEMTDPKIEDYGVKLLNDKEVFQTKAMSVLGNFTYGYANETGYHDYFSQLIWGGGKWRTLPSEPDQPHRCLD